MADPKKLVGFIRKWEGGFVNDPLDRGGATNKGVTLRTFRFVFGQDKTVEDLKNMTDGQWFYIYKKYYWDKWKADYINNQSVANILVDWVWGSGKWGIIIPQRLLKVKDDGIVGDKTINAVNKYDPKSLFDDIKEEREIYLETLVSRHPKQIRFLPGWMNRLNDLKFEV